MRGGRGEVGPGFRFASSGLRSPAQCEGQVTPSDPKQVLDEFCVVCERAWMDYELYRSLCETDQRTMDMCNSIAPRFFEDIARILIEHQIQQFCKITDPAKSGGKPNLTTNYVLQELAWPDGVRLKLAEVNQRLDKFRQCIVPARNKRTAHVDLVAQIHQVEDLGSFPQGAEKEFLRDLQTFVDIAYGHLHNGAPRPIDVAMSTDTHQLFKALEMSAIFDRCTKCEKGERTIAVFNYRREGRTSGA